MLFIAAVEWPYALVLWTIRVSLLCSVLALFFLIGTPRGRLEKGRIRRLAQTWWTLGLAIYVVHVLLAFHVVHHWSHAQAVQHTADKSAAVAGIRFGGGVYFNHLLTAFWLADVIWWWSSPRSHAERPRWLTFGWHAYFLFIAANATIVFESGPIRWFGIAAAVVLAYRWRNRKLDPSKPAGPPHPESPPDV